MLMRVPGLTLNRFGVYVFRKVVPPDLRPAIGAGEIKRSLETKSKAEALLKLPEVRLEVERILAAAAGAVVLNPVQARVVADRWLAAKLSEDAEARRADGFRWDEDAALGHSDYADRLQEVADWLGQPEPGRLARKKQVVDVSDEVAAILRAEGFAIARDTLSWALLERELLLATIKLHREIERRLEGEWGKAPRFTDVGAAEVIEVAKRGPAKLMRSAPGTPKLSELVEKWAAERKPPTRTLMEWRASTERFKALHGDLRVDTITKPQVVAVKDELLKQGKSAPTVEKAITALRVLLGYAVDNGLVDHNVAVGVRVIDPNAGRERRLPFLPEQLKAIFSHAVFTEGKRPRAGGGEAAYWLPVLGLYTGSRLDELASLKVADVGTEGDVMFIDIHDRDEGKRVKTKGSRRKVPLHPDVIELGFKRYLATLPANGDLFPLVRSHSKGPRSSAFSKWFARTLDGLGITDRRLVFHSFRHGFKDACRDAGMAKDVHDRLTGHASQDVGDSYGVGYSIKRLDEELARIEWKGLSIPKWRASIR
jgi:integrase